MGLAHPGWHSPRQLLVAALYRTWRHRHPGLRGRGGMSPKYTLLRSDTDLA